MTVLDTRTGDRLHVMKVTLGTILQSQGDWTSSLRPGDLESLASLNSRIVTVSELDYGIGNTGDGEDHGREYDLHLELFIKEGREELGRK